jgi:DNA repair protein RecN (Recombination protein N)
MLRSLSIRNFAVVETLDAEFGPGFTVLTGETGAGKSILLDALSLLLGDRFEARQLRPGAERAEISAEFDLSDAPATLAWLNESDLGAADSLLLRRVLDAQGRSRAWINGSSATLAQLEAVGELLIDVHGQHAHQSLGRADTQRLLLDAFGGFATLAAEVAVAWRAWRESIERHQHGTRDAASRGAERDALAARHAELSTLGATATEWTELGAAQSRLAHAASLLEAATAGEAELVDGDAALNSRLTALLHRLRQAASHDRHLDEIVALVDEARIGIDEAGRMLRHYRERLELDPAELTRVETRLAAIHDVARKYRVRAEDLPQLASDTAAALEALSAGTNIAALAALEARAKASFDSLAKALSAKRKFAAAELGHRVSTMMAGLAMEGGRVEIALAPLAEPASFGLERVEFLTATHPKQSLGPLSRVASGGELSRLGLAIQVVLSEVGMVPTLIFDEVDAGIGGGVAAAVGSLLRQLGERRQVLCVTHLPQVAACADAHCRVTKKTRKNAVSTELALLGATERVEEIARMLGGHDITAKTRAHAKELLLQSRPANPRPKGKSAR